MSDCEGVGSLIEAGAGRRSQVCVAHSGLGREFGKTTSLRTVTDEVVK
jgi:hypothetical protein